MAVSPPLTVSTVCVLLLFNTSELVCVKACGFIVRTYFINPLSGPYSMHYCIIYIINSIGRIFAVALTKGSQGKEQKTFE